MRSILLVSIGLNVLLGALVYSWVRTSGFPEFNKAISPPALTNAHTYKTNVVIRRLNFSWKEIETPNYAEFIANLRSIECPEQTIRDIIVADVNEMFSQRILTEVDLKPQPWWRSEPDPALIQTALEQIQVLEAERRMLLTDLLGPDWERPPPLVEPVHLTALDGPVLGNLSKETEESVRAVEARMLADYEDRLRLLEESGQPVTRKDLAELEHNTRRQLAQILTPAQLEEYLLRYSQNANALRNELKGLEVTPDEFRNLFRIRDPLEQQYLVHFSPEDNAGARAGLRLQQQIETAMRQTLGPERFEVYRYMQDPLFRQTRDSVENIGAPPESVLPIHAINQVTQEEQNRIWTDANLTPEERIAAWQATLLQQQNSLRQILGAEAYQRYLQTPNALPLPPFPQ